MLGLGQRSPRLWLLATKSMKASPEASKIRHGGTQAGNSCQTSADDASTLATRRKLFGILEPPHFPAFSNKLYEMVALKLQHIVAQLCE